MVVTPKLRAIYQALSLLQIKTVDSATADHEKNSSYRFRLACVKMNKLYLWKETKRKANLVKHGLDFIDADLVFSDKYRYEIESTYPLAVRKHIFALLSEILTVLTVIYQVDKMPHIVSFRYAYKAECEIYNAWLEYDNNDV